MRPNGIAMSMLLLGLDIALLAPSRADTLTVCPDGTGDYTLIQQAIDAAVDGDIVELCDGEFVSYITFRGKAITVRSTSGDPSRCVIRSPVVFESGEGPSSVLMGVTVSSSGNLSAVYCGDSSPTVEDVAFVNCHNAIAGVASLVRSDAIFRRCVFQGNSASDADARDNGAISVFRNAPRFEDCAFLGNHARWNAGCVGVALGTPTFLRCTFAGNRALLAGGAFVADRTSHVTLDHCILRDNCAGTVGDEAFVAGGSTLTLICCAVDSTGIAGAGTINYVGENLFVDPLFCAPISCDAAPTTAGDYRLAQNSPCLLGPCGQIGAFGQGCGIIGIDAWSWGRIKALHR